VHGSSYHAKELAAANQTSRRLQNLQLQHMQQELQLLEQQLDIERAARSTAVSFLNSKASSLHDATVSWHARQEEDALTKEREIEVRHTGPTVASAQLCKQWRSPSAPCSLA
jgi:hypothetical protein